MSPNVPCTRITGGAAERQLKSFAPGGGTPGACAPAGAAVNSSTAATSTAASARMASGSHPCARRAQTSRGGSRTEPEALGQRRPGERGGHQLGHRGAVLEAMAGPAAEQPHGRVLRVAAGNEVRVGGQLVAAR